MKKLFFVLIILILSSSDMYSQCSMLSAIMESDQEYEAAKGLNRGIAVSYTHLTLPTSDLV